MKAYFDSTVDNLSTPLGAARQIAADNAGTVRQYLTDIEVEPVISTDYSEQGIYIVNVTGFANHWSGFAGPHHLRHILYELSLEVIAAARARKVIIVLNSQAEGFPIIFKGVDGYREMHKAMGNLKLPAGSVLLIDANRDSGSEYDIWRAENNEPKMFEHLHFLSCFYYFYRREPQGPLILQAMANDTSKDFNALNRMVRQHRMDLIYRLITDNLHSKGLVSGHYNNLKHKIMASFITPTYVDVEYDAYVNLLMKNCPLTIDGDWSSSNPDLSKDHIFNHSIYANSLLSVVTETAFHDSGMFITEKVFKSIVAGHPFLVMGQPRYLEALEDLGYKVDFCGIDRKYDRIKSPQQRFNAVYEELKKWTAIGRGDKIRLLNQSLETIIHNQKLYKSNDYTLQSYQQLKSKLKEMFHMYGQS